MTKSEMIQYLTSKGLTPGIIHKRIGVNINNLGERISQADEEIIKREVEELTNNKYLTCAFCKRTHKNRYECVVLDTMQCIKNGKCSFYISPQKYEENMKKYGIFKEKKY